MKLNRENFTKQEYDGGTLYNYVCKETNFYLLVKGKGSRKEISVFKGDVDNRGEEFKTTNTLEAWNKFEEMLVACDGSQGSSGGFAKNPQQNTQMLPLLAIKRNDDNGTFAVTFFALLGDQTQTSVMAFEIGANALIYPYPKKVFVSDWINEEIPAIFQCEVIMKRYEEIVFAEDPDTDVFLFIPKSIVTQGGDQGGEPDGEGGGDQSDINEDDGEPSDEEGGNSGGGEGEPTEDDGEPSDEEGGNSGGGDYEPSDDGGKTKVNTPIDYSDIINRIAVITDNEPSTINSVFRTVNTGETFLLLNNFTDIKSELNLPADITAKQLSEQIINSK